MFFFSFLVIALSALQTQVVLAARFKLQFPDAVQQCEPVTIAFTGNVTTAVVLPLTLSVMPFNATAIFIPIPETVAAPSGVYVTFLPLEAGTSFVASLFDSSGDNLPPVSDIIKVLPSPSGNNTCLPTSEATEQNHFQIDETAISQCEEFTVQYDTAFASSAPSVRLYSPRGSSFRINSTFDDPSNGTAKYLMNWFRGFQVLLSIDDGSQFRTTNLFTVGGDSSSKTSCFKFPNSSNSTGADTTSGASMNSSVSKTVIIGSAVGGAAIFLIAIGMILFILRERRRKRRKMAPNNSTFYEKRSQDSPSTFVAVEPSYPAPAPYSLPAVTYPEGALSNPVYTSEKYQSPALRPLQLRSSMSSWSQAIPDDQRFSASKAGIPVSIPPESRRVSRQTDRLSLNSLDIEGMLNMAAIQSERNSRVTVDPLPPITTITPTPTSYLPVPRAQPRQYPARGHLRDPSDVPADPTSMALSGYSLNPFSDDRSEDGLREQSFFPRSAVSTLRSPPSAVVGLPSSPRQGPRFSRDRYSNTSGAWNPTSQRSSRGTTSGDWYGIAR